MFTSFLNEYMITQNKVEAIVMIGIQFEGAQDFLLNTPSFDYLNYNQSYHDNKLNLRGGGCVKSQMDNVIDVKLKSDQNLMISSQQPDNYQTNLNESLKFIVEEAQCIGDTTKRNEVLMKIQWFIYNREHLNYFCVNERETNKIYGLVQENFGNMLSVLTTYLRISGFICYQILQICNELLRIIYAFQLNNSQRCFEVSVQQDYIQKLSEFNTQLEIEQANAWKTGMEFEITIMKIMIINSQTNSTEGTDLLIDFFIEAGKSIVSFSPTEDLLSTIISGGQFLLKKGIEKQQYPKETYQTYYLFQLIKWSIIRQLKSKQSVYKQIQQLKDVFQQYILVSNNWILHFCWIQMITDIISYRPIIDKTILFQKKPNQLSNKWNNLIENDLIQCVLYNKNEAIMTLFQDKSKQIYDIEITDFLEVYGKKKFLLFVQFLLKGEFAQNINHWDFYKNFNFKYQKEKKQEDFEIILANYEQEILQKLINNLKFQKDDFITIYQQILHSFHNYFKQESQIPIQIFQDDQQVSIRQFQGAYKKLILLCNYIQELSLFETAKFHMLTSYLDQFKISKNKTNLLDCLEMIDNFIMVDLNEFIDQIQSFFINVIQFASQIYESNIFLANKLQKDIDKLMNILEINNFLIFFQTFETKFAQFALNLNYFKHNFTKFIQKEIKIEKNISIQVENIGKIIENNYQGEWIIKIIKKLKNNLVEKLQLFNYQLINLEDASQILIDCKFNILALQYLKQFFNIQNHYLKKVEQQLQNYTKKFEFPKEQEDKNFKGKVIELLLSQKQKLSLMINLQTQETDEQTYKTFFKGFVFQIQSDFDFIRNESQTTENLDLCNEILKFFAESQFLILQVQKEPEELPSLKNLITKYDQILEQVNKFDANNNEKMKKLQIENDNSQNSFPQIQQRNEQMLKLIKQCNKYFKSYKKLLQLGLNLIYQQKSIYKQKQSLIQQILQKESQNDEQKKFQDQLIQLQQSEQQDFSTQIKNLKEKSDKFFSVKVKTQIKQMIDGLQIEDKQKNQYQLNVNLQLPEFLSFFYQKSSQEYSQGLKPDVINDSIWQEMKNCYIELKEKLIDSIELKSDYKVREGLVYNLIRLQQCIQEQQIYSFSTKYLQYIWVYEKDQKVRSLLKNKELIQIQKLLFSSELDNLSSSIKDEIKERMQKLENLQQQIKLEGNSQKREQLQLELKQTYEELDQSLDNISEMSEAMDISLLFLKDISKDIKQIKGQIENLQESLNQVGDDIRKLRGKRYDELLEIRKQKILFQQKITEIDSVYIQLQTIEYDPSTGLSVKTNDNIEISQLMADKWNDYSGEVNEFIWNESKQKDVMLLSGNAGSGKSKAARKIEEFIWNQKGISSKWTPIFVSLPTLKNPKYNLFEQALESENYQFDKYQIREFKEAIQNKKEFIILILDSYDEMKQDCIQSNLIMTNKLIQELNIDKIDKQMKVIITTRKEILHTSGYQTWFYGESLLTLKEVQLQNFNQKQQDEYLNQYVELSVKKKIKEIYEFVKQITGQSFNLEEFISIWSLISFQVNNFIKKSMIRKQDRIFQDKEEDFIIEKIKTNKTLEVLKDEQTNALKKELLSLWSANKFKTSIESVKIQDLLTTPFMLEIIVQVLPNITKRYSGSTEIKDIFIKNYMKLKKQLRFSQNAREYYNQENQPFQIQQQQDIPNLDDEQMLDKQKEEEYQSKIEIAKINEIIDSLENQKFFQNYSIVSVLKHEQDTIFFDGNTINLNSDDTNIVVMSLKMKKFTVFEFYESFINFYHEQQIQKQRELGKVSNYESFAYDIYQFSYSLALDMTLQDLSQIGYKPQGKLDLKSNYKIEQVVDDWLKQYFDIEDEYKKLIRSCILLSAKGSTYSFTHKSIQEFYVAKYIFDVLMSLNNLDSDIQQVNDDNLQKNLSIFQKSIFNNSKFNISTVNFKGVINFIREKLNNVDRMNQKLIQIVKLSKMKDQDFSRSASNSIYLLSQINVYLGSQDFSKIKLANTNISGLSLFDCDISCSIFQNVEINSCNFNLADLSNVQWQNVICKEKPLIKGHNTRILEVQISPNGQYIASTGEDNNIKLWDTQTYQLIQNLEGHKAQVNTLSFSSDSTLLFSGSNDFNIGKWDLRNIQSQVQLQLLDQMKNKVQKVQISQDQKKLYSQDSDGNFQILDLSKEGQSEECVFKIDNKFIKFFALHPTEPIVAVISQINEIELHNFQTKEIIKLEANLDPRYNKIIQLIFSPQGSYLAVATQNTVIVWNIAVNTSSNQIIFNFSDIILTTIIFSEDSQQLIFGTSDFIFIKEINKFHIKSQDQQQKYYQFSISPKGKIAATVYDKKLSIQDIDLAQIISSIELDLQPDRIQFSTDGSKLSLFLKDNQEFKLFNILEVPTLKTICFIPWNANYWNKYILSNNFEKLFILQDNYSKIFKDNEKNNQDQQNRIQQTILINTNKIYMDAKIKKLNLQIKNFCVKSNSQIMAYISQEVNSIKIFDLEKNLLIQELLENQNKDVQAFQFSPTNNELAIGYQGEILFWNLDSQPFKFQNRISFGDLIIKSINYSPDGSQIVLVFQDLFQIYDIKSCSLLKVVEQQQIKGQVQFSQDNNLIGFYLGNPNKHIVIISKNKNYEQKLLDGHKDQIVKIIFTQDQKSIISGSCGELILWDIFTYQIKVRKDTGLKDFNSIIFSYDTNLLALHYNGVVEIWKYSENVLIFIGSQVFDLPIIQLSFFDNNQFLILQKNNLELIQINLDYFQFEQTFEQFFDCGAISSNNLIALVKGEEINIFSNNFEKCIFAFKGGLNIKYLRFFETKQNLLLIHQDEKIKIWDYEKGLQICEIKLIQNTQILQFVKDEILITQNEKTVKIWNIRDLNKIKLCGYHQEIDSFSIQEDGKCGTGIKDGQNIIINDVFNLEFAFPINSNQYIKQLHRSNLKQILIILSYTKRLFIIELNQRQEHQFNGDVNAMAYSQQKDYIVIQTESKIQLIKFQKGNFNIIDTFDLQTKINDCIVIFTNDGEGFSLSSYYMIRLFQISRNQKLICNVMHYQLEKNYIIKDPQLRLGQIFQKQGVSNKYQLLAILDQEKKQFRIIDLQKSKQIVLIKGKLYYNMFQLSFDEEIIFFVNDYVQVSILENKNLIIKKIENLKVEGFLGLTQEQLEEIHFTVIGTTKKDINCLTYLHKQDWLALSTDQNNIMFWDIKAKKNVGILKGHQKKINSLSVSQDGNFMASSSDDKVIKLWNINNNETLETQKAHQYSINALALSLDGFLLASGSIKGLEVDVPIFIWDLIEKQLIIQLKGHKDSVNYLEFSNSSKYLISGSKDGTIILWNIEYPKNTEILQIIDDFNFPVNSLSFSPKEQIFISFCQLDNIQKWNFKQNGKQEKQNSITLNTNSKNYCFFKKHQFIYVEQIKDQLTIINFENLKQEILEQNSQIKQIITTLNDSHIFCLDSQGALISWQRDKDNKWFKKWIYIVESNFILLSPNCQFLFQAKDCTTLEQPLFTDPVSNKFRILFHDFQKLLNTNEKLNYQFQKSQVNEIVFSYDLSVIVIISTQEFKIFNINNWQCIKEFQVSQSHNKPQMSQDNKYLASFQDIQYKDSNKYDSVINLWQIDNPINLIKLEIKESKLKLFQFSQVDSNQIYALYSDGIVRDWNIKTKTNQVLVTLSETTKNDLIIFSKSLKYLIYQSENKEQIIIWNFLKQQKSSLSVGEQFYLIACSQNENLFAVAINKGIKIFKDQQESIIYVFNDLNLYQVTQICFSHDDKQLLFCQDNTIYLYQIEEDFNNKILGCWNVQSQILQCVFNSKKQEVALKLNNQLIILNLSPSILKSELLSIENQKSTCFSPDSKYLASLVPTLQLQDMQNIQMIHNFEDYEGDLISFQSQEILVIANRNKLQFINIKKIDKIVKIKEVRFQNKIIDIALSNNYLLIQFKDNFDQIKIAFNSITNFEDNQFKAIYNCKGKPIFQESGNYFALSNQNIIKIINVDKIQQERCLQINKKINQGQLFYSHDGNVLFLCFDQSIQILNSTNFQKIQEITINISASQIEFCQSWKYLAFMCSTTILIYFISNWTDLVEFWTIQGDQNVINSIALSPKGNFLLTSGQNQLNFTNSIGLWKVEQRRQICINDKVNDEVKVLKFCLDGLNFVAGLSDGSVNLYSINIKQTNFYKKTYLEQEQQLNDDTLQFQIICFKSFAKQSLLTSQLCILTEQSQINSEQKSIIELFKQKR
ncbi:unnamed protein product [Paramecium sonneborni]|uniref:NACHT domain-containing protein n=1 Tax=Paramecium sonneborni TaxID=65129 RepID=A0A8S1P8B7_9CILI|nr:unnamed protein product [Paramecium sonneborni]